MPAVRRRGGGQRPLCLWVTWMLWSWQNVAAPQHSCQPTAAQGVLCACQGAAVPLGPELCCASDSLWNVLGWDAPWTPHGSSRAGWESFTQLGLEHPGMFTAPTAALGCHSVPSTELLPVPVQSCAPCPGTWSRWSLQPQVPDWAQGCADGHWEISAEDMLWVIAVSDTLTGAVAVPAHTGFVCRASQVRDNGPWLSLLPSGSGSEYLIWPK